MTRPTKLLALGVIALILILGTSAGACKFVLACGLDRFGVGTTRPVDAPPIESGRAQLPDGFFDRTVVGGLIEPTDFAFLPDGRVMFTQKGGLVRISPAGGGRATTILDLRRRVSTFDIRGLLTITIDPGFPRQPYVYVLYTGAAADAGEAPTTTYLSRFTWNGRELSPTSERKLVQIPQQEAHAGGQVAFASDGTIFVSTGDAAASDGKELKSLRAQDLDQLPGKVLRVTRQGLGVDSNPFWNGDPAANRSRVWAYGFRNPFRLTLAPQSELPVVGELGFLREDEIDVIRRGGNYGWPCVEGRLRGPGAFPRTETCEALYAKGDGATVSPIVANDRKSGASITGGAFYEADAYPEQYRGAFFYADFSYGWLRYLRLGEQGDLAEGPSDFGTNLPGPVALHVGPDGTLYYLSLTTGQLRRIEAAGG
jgi:glucose/arabinose dehydrogenase